MKKFENKVTKIKNGKVFVNYVDLARAAIQNTPQGGFEIAEMRKRNRVLGVLDKSIKDITLEDNDFEKLKDCLSKMHWAIIHPDIIEFCDVIENLK